MCRLRSPARFVATAQYLPYRLAIPYGASGPVSCGRGVSTPVVEVSLNVETEFAVKFEVKSQKSPLAVPSERRVMLTGFAPVEVDAGIREVNWPVTALILK